VTYVSQKRLTELNKDPRKNRTVESNSVKAIILLECMVLTRPVARGGAWGAAAPPEISGAPSELEH